MNVIEAHGLRKEFTVRVRKGLLRRERRTVAAVDGVDLVVQRGEMLGYLGPNGAGKSTTLKMLTGVLHPSGGRVAVCGLTPVPQRIQRANQLLGSALGGREEAVEVLTQSADPWLRSCAAYTIGELHLRRFAPVLEQWTRDPDPLLRAAAEDAQQKLKEAATITSGESVI